MSHVLLGNFLDLSKEHINFLPSPSFSHFNDLEVEMLSWKDHSEYNTKVEKTKDYFSNYLSHYKTSEPAVFPYNREGKKGAPESARQRRKAFNQITICLPSLYYMVIITLKKREPKLDFNFYFYTVIFLWIQMGSGTVYWRSKSKH